METQYRCKNERRRIAVRDAQVNGRPLLNGIDYLEVSSDAKTVMVHFIHHLAGSPQTRQVPPNLAALNAENLQIVGGSRLPVVPVESVTTFANVLMIRVGQVGDFSAYTLRLITSTVNLAPPPGFDPQLAQVDFSFWVEEFSEFDCKLAEAIAPSELPPPVIDYLAKDYSSFRQLMLDRLAVTMPQWQQRNPADLGIMLVEMMAYAADHLSYYQDAVATEAYLGTARKRVSIRRHARLLDYLMHDGCNARAWVVLDLDQDASLTANPIRLLGPSKLQNRPGVQLFTKTLFPSSNLPLDQLNTALNAGAQVFETLHDVVLDPALDTLHFYTWEDDQCCLPKGSTRATLQDPDGNLQKRLSVGNVLVFEEVLGSATGESLDADASHRHVVRLTQAKGAIDPLNGQQLVEIGWAVDDALPFDLKLSSLKPNGDPITNMSVARGNVVLVDAGRSLPAEDITQAPGWARLRPRLQEGPLTQQGQVEDAQNQWGLFDPNAPASAAMQWKLRDARPAIALWENQLPSAVNLSSPLWEPQRDLLNSDRFARDFVVEAEDDGRAYLRFGDGNLGKVPPADTPLYANYRIGNGKSGNVGARAIANILIQPENLEEDDQLRIGDIRAAITAVYNPLPAQGGTEPEPIEQVRLYAPQAFQEPRRAVTEADYAAMAQQYPGVRKALAVRRWTGSWHTLFITIDRAGGRPVDDEFKQGLLAFLEEFRLTGHDLEIEGPRFVPLNIAMTVQVQPDYFQGVVKKALLDALSNRVLAEGKMGFFHLDRFTFGQAVYLSQVVSTVMQVSGVQSVRVTRFQRWGEPSNRELETGRIQFEQLEIARLDNAPNAPENGRLEFNLEGGL